MLKRMIRSPHEAGKYTEFILAVPCTACFRLTISCQSCSQPLKYSLKDKDVISTDHIKLRQVGCERRKRNRQNKATEGLTGNGADEAIWSFFFVLAYV